jgi:hypothetical protein
MKVYQSKPLKGESTRFTIDTLEALITEDMVRTYSLGPALKRLGRALARQFDRRQVGSREVIGVDLKHVGFRLLLRGRAPRKRTESGQKADRERTKGS